MKNLVMALLVLAPLTSMAGTACPFEKKAQRRDANPRTNAMYLKKSPAGQPAKTTGGSGVGIGT